MGKNDIFIHGTLSDAINWEEFFNPMNYGESYLDNKYATNSTVSKSESKGKVLAKKNNPCPREKNKGGNHEY